MKDMASIRKMRPRAMGVSCAFGLAGIAWSTGAAEALDFLFAGKFQVYQAVSEPMGRKKAGI